MFAQRTTHQIHYDLVGNQLPVYGIKYVPYKQDSFRIMIAYYVCDVKYPILSASRLLDRGLTSIHDTEPSHRDNNKRASPDTQDSSTYEQKKSTSLQDSTSTQ